jgi:hypothetical protein
MEAHYNHLVATFYNSKWKENFKWKIGIVIPAFAEPNILHLIHSLIQSEGIAEGNVSVLIVINHGIHANQEEKQLNDEGYRSLCHAIESWPMPAIVQYYSDLPEKHSGVGFARKLGMDFLAELLLQRDEPKGAIVNLDADCTVSPNYIKKLSDWQRNEQKTEGASIYFEHPLPTDPMLKKAILCYELHLRYYIEVQRSLGLPYAFHTIGSAMIVRAERYRKSGGMNTRKAGEDFYFLQKLIKAAPFADILDACVYPSARISTRVPFGTGRAILEFLNNQRYSTTYSLKGFDRLKPWLSDVKKACTDAQQAALTTEDTVLNSFLESVNYSQKWHEICTNSKPGIQRWKRFMQWFDAFLLMKWCHYFREQTNEEMQTTTAANMLMKRIMPSTDISDKPEELLTLYRLVQRNSDYSNSVW